jgi:branched-subunit amino acid transport protein
MARGAGPVLRLTMLREVISCTKVTHSSRPLPFLSKHVSNVPAQTPQSVLRFPLVRVLCFICVVDVKMCCIYALDGH